MGSITSNTNRRGPRHVVIVGAGIGGLTAACELARFGIKVVLVERRHLGGCATTFNLDGVAYDAGATLCFGLDHPGLLGGVLADLEVELPHHTPPSAWEVHGEGFAVSRWVDRARWLAEAAAVFGPRIEGFWEECEMASDIVLEAALRRPPLPPTRVEDWARIMTSTSPRKAARLAPMIARPLVDLLRRHGLDGGAFHRFCDLQLLITAQAPASEAMSLYAALALVLPHRGTAVLKGGMGSLAEALGRRFKELGGELVTDEAVTVERRLVTLASGRRLATDAVVLNVTPWDARRLLGQLPARHERRLAAQRQVWGALCLYITLPADDLPEMGRFIQIESPVGSVLGDRQSVFVSIAAEERQTPQGLRPATVSVHSRRDQWPGRGSAYNDLKAASQAAVLEMLAPHLPSATNVITATPETWVEFAGRAGGRVGGFPALAGTPPPLPFPPRIGPGIWMVGDSVVPGQSTMAVALAGRTIAAAVRAGR
ncbi:MAG: NAD(P)/FAD-dependent oxidoreductase [Actinomycetota bacterium]